MATAPQKNKREIFLEPPATIPEPTLRKRARFAREPIVTGRIIFLGDSITEMGDWKGMLSDASVINRGIGGDLTSRVLRRLKDITDRHPSKLFILLGINDIGKGIPSVVIADNYLKMIGEIHDKCPSTMVYVQSVLPVNPELPNFPRHYQAKHILALNKLLASHASAWNYTYIHLFPLLADGKGHLASQFTYDGLHLRQSAYAIWVDYLKREGYL